MILCVFLMNMYCLQTMTDVAGNPEEERTADFYHQPWAQEAVCRYFYGKVRASRLKSHSGINKKKVFCHSMTPGLSKDIWFHV